MKAAAFDYLRASSVDEAVEALAAHEDAKVLAGGQSLVPLLNLRLARPSVIVDINHLDLGYVRRNNGHLAIGALTRQRVAETSSLIQTEAPLLAEALQHIGHVTIRNRGTIGGSIAHADPAAELPAVALALDASFVVHGTRGSRVIAAADFFRGPLTTALDPDELLVEVRVPVWPGACAVEELTRRHGDFALVAVFVAIAVDPDGTCQGARIAVSGAGPVPVRARAAEAALIGRTLSALVISEAAQQVPAATEPSSDIHAPAEYRREMSAVLARRAITRAIGGAR